MNTNIQLLANAISDSIERQRMAFYQQAGQNLDTKHHRLWDEFGYTKQLTFDLLHDAYMRHPAAHSAVHTILDETWSDNPKITKKEDKGGVSSGPTETPATEEANALFERLWSRIKDADRKQMVGNFAGLLVQYRDSQDWDQPVNKAVLAPQGVLGIVDLIPVWQGQLMELETDSDTTSETYGLVRKWNFQEGVIENVKQPRNITVHHERIILMAEGSEDGNPYSGTPLLEAGFNNLVNLQKVSGAAPESYYKNAARQLVYMLNENADLDDLREMAEQELGEGANLKDLFNKIAANLNTGFDSAAAIKDGTIAPIEGQVHDPKGTWQINAQEFAASVGAPMRKLFGSEEGKLAADQDSKGFSKKCMSRRGWISTITNKLIDAFVFFGILKAEDYEIQWSDLLEPSFADKLDMVVKMTTANKTSTDSGYDLIFTSDEIREIIGYAPLSATERGLPEPPEEEASNTPPAKAEA